MRASDRRSRSRKPAAIRATLTPAPSPAERERGDYGIGSNTILKFSLESAGQHTGVWPARFIFRELSP